MEDFVTLLSLDDARLLKHLVGGACAVFDGGVNAIEFPSETFGLLEIERPCEHEAEIDAAVTQRNMDAFRESKE